MHLSGAQADCIPFNFGQFVPYGPVFDWLNYNYFSKVAFFTFTVMDRQWQEYRTIRSCIGRDLAVRSRSLFSISLTVIASIKFSGTARRDTSIHSYGLQVVIRLPFLPFCIFMLNAGLIPVAAAHTVSSTGTGASLLSMSVEPFLMVSTALLLWMIAASIAARVGGILAVALFSASSVTAIGICLFWHVDAWVLTGLFLSGWLYAAGLQRLRRATRHSTRDWRRRAVIFNTGLALLVVALVSPVDTLGEELFSMHMVQHELLMLGAAPLMVAGRPLAVFIWAFPATWRARIGRTIKSPAILGPWTALTGPLAAWSLHALILWAWHFPSLFQASLADDSVHTAQHLSFLLSALLFWSSLLGPQSRLRHGSAVLYLLTTAMHTGMLGALLTFSPLVWYPIYATRTAEWGLTTLQDQQLGGLIMWVPAGLVFVFAGLALAARLVMPLNSRQQDIPPMGNGP